MMIKRAVVIFALVFGAQQGAATGLQDVICDDRDRLYERLVQVHGAIKRGQGMRGPDAVVEVWVEPRTSEWALVQSYPNGTSCIVAMGNDWESAEPAKDPA
ncbi:MAG: hypothetical protein AAF665_05895 [Pseudomonadota bacterium]